MSDEIKEMDDVETKETDTKIEESQKPENRPFGFKIPEVVSKVISKIRGESGKSKSNSALGSDEIKTDEADEPELKEVDEQVSKEVESPSSESSDDEIVDEEIPYHLVQAAREFGWSDEKIVKIAEADISVLEDIYNKSKPELKKEVEKEKPIEVPKLAIEEDVLKKWREDYGDDAVDKVIKPLIDAQNKLSEQVSSLQEGLTRQNQEEANAKLVNLFNNFNSALDKLSKDYPEFGIYEKMPKRADGNLIPSPEFTTRGKVYETAIMFMRNGYPEDKAIEQAIHWYAGTQGEQRAERKIVMEINDQKKKFSPKPSAKKTAKTYTTVDEKKAGIIAEAKKAAGIK